MRTLSTPERLALLRLAKATAPMQPQPTLSPIEPADRSRPLPLSLAQQRLWLGEQLGGADTARCVRTSLTLTGTLDRTALARALNRIVARHEALRTTFYVTDGEPAQRVAPVEQSGFHLTAHDLTGPQTPDGEFQRLVAEEVNARFDLERGPLIRGRLIRRSPDDHLLLVTMHHIVSDGWSLELFTSELRALYGAFLRGAPDPLPELPLHYADYAAWQRRWVSGDVLRQQEDYWKQTLAGAPELLELPTDQARPTRQSRGGAIVGVELDEALTSGLKALSLRHGTTLFMTILAGWAAVLSRLSGQNDVVIGTPMAGRSRQEIEGLIGFFVNSLPIRIELPGTLTVTELLGRAKERVLHAQHHQDIPFDQVVELVHPARSLSHHPMFQVMFAWQTAPQAKGRTRPAELDTEGVKYGAAVPVHAEFDASLWLMEADGRIAGSMTYATALFERETVERHVGYLRRALAAMVADDRQNVGRLRLQPDSERLQVIEAWNRTETAYPEACVHDLFETQVAQTPESLALTMGEHALTYAELNARANRLAHHLRERGVAPDARVALYLERGLEMVIGLFAILKAGGAYVPLDPAHPVDRLETMLADCTPVMVLTQIALVERLGGVTIPILILDAEPSPWGGHPATNPARAALTPDHLAYVIYTSGSTGKPKGVMNLHRGVVNLLWSIGNAVGMRPADRLLAVTTLSFDIAALELFLPLMFGARVEVLPRAAASDSVLLQRSIAVSGATVMQATPATWWMLLEGGWTGEPRLRALCGGEALASDLARRLCARVGALWNVYGPTETTIWSSAQRVGAASVRRALVPLGTPVANTRIYVLGRDNEPNPSGVVGEIYIGGAGVARGYYGRSGLTAERFVPDPFGLASGARMYRTGDLGRWLADGTVEFAGRVDHQVKVRGFRIEPGEIEARLMEHAAVRDAVVVAREDTPGEQRLVAYVVGDPTAGAEQLRAYLSETLPNYMVPAAYVRLGSLPLNANGKLDRHALPVPDSHAYPRRGYEAPLGETEELLARIWAEVLRLERVGRTDNFFELGGYSFLAVQMLSRVREELATDVPTGGVFAWPMLADFARELTSPSQLDLPALAPVAREGSIPLSFHQSRQWLLERNAGAGAARRTSVQLRLKGRLDRAALVGALDRIVSRHEALRTTVVQVGDAPEQRIAPVNSRFHLVEDDLRAGVNADAELTRLMIAEARAPFALSHGPLSRGRLIRIDDDDHVLVISMHPMIADGWSMEIVTRELTALYGAFSRGEPDPLGPPPLQYADYAIWQRRCVADGKLKAQADYWQRTLRDAPELLGLPLDHPRPAHHDYAGAKVAVELDARQTQALRDLARRHRVTVFMALLAGWGIVLHRLSGQDDVVIGSPIANRRRRETHGTIGSFENALALRLNLSGRPTVAALLAQAKARTVEAHHHQDLPIEAVAESERPVRPVAHTPIFQVMFAWRNAPQREIALPGLAVTPVVGAELPVLPQSVSPTTARFDLMLSLTERGERIVGTLTYATALFKRETVDRHASYLRLVLEAMAADDQLAADAFSFAEDKRETPRAEVYAMETSAVVRGQEASVAEMEGDQQRSITIRGTGLQSPLLIVDEETAATGYAQLLEPYIADDIPVYVLPTPSSAASPSHTVEGMATRLVRMIREIRPRGPYRVLGRAFGAALAYEIATQLLGQDEVVEFVGMVDPDTPGPCRTECGDTDEHGLFRDALREYVPQRIPAPVHLFAAEQRAVAAARGWSGLIGAGALQVTPVPATPPSMIGPADLASLGRLLSGVIAGTPKAEKPLRSADDLPVLSLQRGKDGVAPLFCMPGAGTSVTSFIELIGCLASSWPVYGFQPRGMDGTTVPHSSVSAAAHYYLLAIQETWPNGPVHLLGHSFGGWIVFETALALREAGRSIGSLTLLDSEVPESDARSNDVNSTRAFLKLVEVLELGSKRPFGIDASDVASLDEGARLTLLHQKMVQHGLLTARSTDKALYGPFRTFARCVRTTYRPSGLYPDRLRLVLVDDPRKDAATNRRQFDESVCGWQRWAPGLVASIGVGNHMTALRSPHVAALARFLAEDRR